MPAVVDADGMVVGRLSTFIAKRLLKGEEIVIVNAQNAIISGSRDAIIEEFHARVRRGSTRKGPYYPRMPDRILRRAVRGMLPYQRSRGKKAYQNLRVFIGVPDEYSKNKAETIPNARKPGLHAYMKLGDISKVLGAKF
jgi:large subunit ribosomal protein L13